MIAAFLVLGGLSLPVPPVQADHGTLGSQESTFGRRPPDAALPPPGGYGAWPRTADDVGRGRPAPTDEELDALRFDGIVQRTRARHVTGETRWGGDVSRTRAFIREGGVWLTRGDWARERAREEPAQAAVWAGQARRAYRQAWDLFVRARRDRETWPDRDEALVEPGRGLTSPWDGTPPRARRRLP